MTTAVPLETSGVAMLLVEDDLADKVVADGVARHVEMLNAVAGPYFECGILAGGRPVWKALDPQNESGALYLWFQAATGHGIGGWYISDRIRAFDNKRDEPTEPLICAWAPDTGNKLPHAFHFPYWAKIPLESGIRVINAYDFLSARVTQLEDQLLSARDDAEDDDAGSAAASSSDKGKGKGDKGSDKDKEGPQSHGGWLPKVAQLASAYYRGDWNRLGKLFSKFYNASAVLQGLVNQKV